MTTSLVVASAGAASGAASATGGAEDAAGATEADVAGAGGELGVSQPSAVSPAMIDGMITDDFMFSPCDCPVVFGRFALFIIRAHECTFTNDKSR